MSHKLTRGGGYRAAGEETTTMTRILTHADVSVLRSIVLLAETTQPPGAAAGRAGELSLVHVLKAYDVVLRQFSIQPEADTFYYRCILKLSLDPEPSWWKKLEHAAAAVRRHAAVFAAAVGAAVVDCGVARARRAPGAPSRIGIGSSTCCGARGVNGGQRCGQKCQLARHWGVALLAVRCRLQDRRSNESGTRCRRRRRLLPVLPLQLPVLPLQLLALLQLLLLLLLPTPH